jgi:regulatory protein
VKPTPKSLKPKLTRVELKQAALGLLALRDHTRHELTQKLSSKAENPEELLAVIDDMTELGYQSDSRFTAAFLHSRSQRFGPNRLKQELHHKGIKTTESTEALVTLDKDWCAQACAVLQKKYPNLDAQDLKQKAKAYRFLASRGFTAEHIRYAFNQIGATDEDF